MPTYRRAITVTAVVVLSALAGALAPAAGAATLPSGFQEQVVFSGLTKPTVVRSPPTGVFVAEKGGRIKVFDDLADTTPTVFADLRPTCTTSGTGACSAWRWRPNFPANPYVYVLYTYDAPLGGDRARAGTTRLRPNAGTTATLRGHRPAVPAAGQRQRDDRQRAGADRTTGASSSRATRSVTSPSAPTACSTSRPATARASARRLRPVALRRRRPTRAPTRPSEGGALRSQDIRTAGDETQLDGTLLRLDPATGAAAAGNPLIGSADPDTRRIVANGLRNPFRITMRPGTNEIWISDTGWNTWEEVNRVVDPDRGVDQLRLAVLRGHRPRSRGYDSANLPICESLYSAPARHAHRAVRRLEPRRQARRRARRARPAARRRPAWRSTTAAAPTRPRTTARSSSPTTRAAASGRRCRPRRAACPTPPTCRRSSPTPPARSTSRSAPAASSTTSTWAAPSAGCATSRGNQPPSAVIDASPTQGPAPLTVTFNGTGSTDPDPADEGRLRVRLGLHQRRR